MRHLLFHIVVLLAVAGCESSATSERVVPALVAEADTTLLSASEDSIPVGLTPYSSIEYEKVELLRAAPGTKSVLFNTNGSKLYAMNLEGMSIYEFDQATREVVREFKFKPTKGTGWDYVKDKPIPSYQEKPVEACLSHDDKILWVSLHNADGIVPIRVDSIEANQSPIATALQGGHGTPKQVLKRVRVIYPGSHQKDSFDVPLIKTGKTPKIISRTADNKYLLVSNWHSYNVSVLEIDKDQYPFAKVIDTATVPITFAKGY